MLKRVSTIRSPPNTLLCSTGTSVQDLKVLECPSFEGKCLHFLRWSVPIAGLACLSRSVKCSRWNEEKLICFQESFSKGLFASLRSVLVDHRCWRWISAVYSILTWLASGLNIPLQLIQECCLEHTNPMKLQGLVLVHCPQCDERCCSANEDGPTFLIPSLTWYKANVKQSCWGS